MEKMIIIIGIIIKIVIVIIIIKTNHFKLTRTYEHNDVTYLRLACKSSNHNESNRTTWIKYVAR